MIDYFVKHFGSWDEVKFLDKWNAGRIMIIEDQKERIGFFDVEIGDGRVHIHEIQLKKQFQRQSTGREIMNYIEQKYPSKNRRIILHVFKNNPAIEFYKKIGFSITGEAHNGASYLLEKKIG